MAIRLNTFRISTIAVLLASMALIGLIAYGRLNQAPLPIEPLKCDPLPPGILKLGPAIVVQQPNVLTDINEQGWLELRSELRQGDVLQSFETEITGGHLAMRGDCLVGQTLAWIR